MYLTPGSSFQLASRRLAAALIASALFHVWVGGSMQGSAGRRASEGPRAAEIAVALQKYVVDDAPPSLVPTPADGALPVRAAASRDARAPRVEPRPKTREAASAAASESATGAYDATYYATRELDVYPAPAQPLVVPYPERARVLGVTGHVQALLQLDATGKVESVAVVEAQPPGYFDSDVRQLFVDARFTPAQKQGRAVKSRVLVHVSFGQER